MNKDLTPCYHLITPDSRAFIPSRLLRVLPSKISPPHLPHIVECKHNSSRFKESFIIWKDLSVSLRDAV